MEKYHNFKIASFIIIIAIIAIIVIITSIVITIIVIIMDAITTITINCYLSSNNFFAKESSLLP